MSEQNGAGIGIFMFIGFLVFLVGNLSKEVPIAAIGFLIFILGMYIQGRYGI